MNHRRDARAVGCDPDGTRSQRVVGGAACACTSAATLQHFVVVATSDEILLDFRDSPRITSCSSSSRPGAVLPALPAARGDMSSARASRILQSIAGGCPGAPRDRTRARPRGIAQNPRPPSSSSRHRRAASLDPDVASTSARTEVFVACVPLVGLEAVGAALGDAYPAPLEHTMVLVRHPGDPVATAYDFLLRTPPTPPPPHRSCAAVPYPASVASDHFAAFPPEDVGASATPPSKPRTPSTTPPHRFKPRTTPGYVSSETAAENTQPRWPRRSSGDPSASKRFSRADGRWRSERGESDTNDIDGGVLVVDTSYYTR